MIFEIKLLFNNDTLTILKNKKLIKSLIFKKTGGKNIYQNIFAMLCMSFFVLAITDLWSILANKDPTIYRSYCIISFAFWWTFAKSIDFNEKKLIKYIFKHLFHYLLFFTTSLILNLIVMKIFHEIDIVLILKRGIYVIFLLLILFSLNLVVSLLSNLNFYISSILGMIKRILFFLTPIIWIPDVAIENKFYILKLLNPLYNISIISQIDKSNFYEIIHLMITQNTKSIIFINLICVILIPFLFKFLVSKKKRNFKRILDFE